MDKKYFIDICTLFEEQYTGIANVNYQVVKYFFENMNNQTEFFHVNRIIKKEYIEQLIRDGHGGDWILSHEQEGTIYKGDLKKKIKNIYSIGVFSHVKYIRNIFNYEVQIIHDITYILTKEFHHEDTIKYHMNFALKDFESNNLNVCNSNATKEDIITYMGVDPKKSIVSLLAVDHEKINKIEYTNFIEKYSVENFIVILGTVEPRKNIEILLKFIEKNPKILFEYKFIFIGRDGWGNTFKDTINKLKIDEKLKSNILHLGFVSEDMKNILIKMSKFLIYPSIYEGFGLPVLEAIASGTPVLTTISSSIPEVGGDISYYFDPYSLSSFSQAFYKLDQDIKNDFINSKLLIEYSKKFTWKRFVEKFLAKIDEEIVKVSR